MSSVKKYLSLVKFSHTIFALPFAIIGFFLSITKSPFPSGYSNSNISQALNLPLKELTIKFGLVLICMVTARSAAMAFNRYLDRQWDAKNPRTAIREIPKGVISPTNALIFTLFNCLVFMVATWFINSICFALSPVALAIVLGYKKTIQFLERFIILLEGH